MLKLVSVHAVVVLMLVHVLVSRSVHMVVLTLLRVVVLTVMGVMPLRSVHASSLGWTCTTLPPEEHQRHGRQRSRRRPSRGRS